jgi:diguanylate cyclase
MTMDRKEDESAAEESPESREFPLLANDTPERAAEYCRLALQKINQHDATLVPLNYALFYFYVSGHSQLLNEKMETLLSKGSDWQHAAATRLFLRYLAPCNDMSMADLQEDLLLVLRALIETTHAAADGFDEHSDALDEHVAKLARCSDPREALQIATQVVKETHWLVRESKSLASETRASTQDIEKFKQELERARHEGTVDSLTGLHNRKTFDDVLKRLVENNEPFGLILMDIDHFKSINDQHGHLIGDRVLRQLAKVLSSRTRATDTVTRYGGEEFAILLPNTELSDTQFVAEKLRTSIGSLNMRRTDNGARIGTVTASFGVAEWCRSETTYELMARTDKALYEAKNNGRNCIALAQRSAPDQEPQLPDEYCQKASPA